jgi:hypothetical protein
MKTILTAISSTSRGFTAKVNCCRKSRHITGAMGNKAVYFAFVSG